MKPHDAAQRPLGERHHFTLGIEALWAEFAALRSPGLYVLLADRESHAQRLAAGVLGALGADDQAEWMVMGGRDAKDPPGLVDAGCGPGRLTLWALDEAAPWAALNGLPAMLDRTWRRRRRDRLVLVKLPASALDGLGPARLARWCHEWHAWSRRRGVCLVPIVHGSRCLALRGRLQPHNDVIDGLAHLQPVGEAGRYLVVHWRSDLRACGGRDLALEARGSGWRLHHAVTQESGDGSDEHRILVQREALGEAPLPSEHWQAFADAREVVAQAVNAEAATVILSLERAGDVEAVARWMHGLRLQRGNALKLVVRELAPCLRYRDERLMALCGVNLVVGHTVPFARFLNRLEGIQGQRFGRALNPDFEAVVASLQPLSASGVVSPAAFIEQIERWLAGDSAEAVSSLLVELRPAGGLSAAQALGQCRLNRQGDLATLIDARLYLFLFGCRLSDLDAALARLFGAPDTALFATRKVFDQRETIALEQRQLIDQGWEAATQLPPIETGTATPEAGAVAPPLHPRPVALVLKPEARP